MLRTDDAGVPYNRLDQIYKIMIEHWDNLPAVRSIPVDAQRIAYLIQYPVPRALDHVAWPNLNLTHIFSAQPTE